MSRNAGSTILHFTWMLIWHVVDHDSFFVLCCFGYLICWSWSPFLYIDGYLTHFWTHEFILTIFRQVIFVDICGYLCVNSFETYGSVLVICVGATNVFSWDLFIGFVVPLVRFWVSEWPCMRVGWDLLTCTHSCCKGFCPRIAKGGDCECLARLVIPKKILECPLTWFTNPSLDYLTFED